MICTANGWYVSCTTPPGRLSVSRYPFFARDGQSYRTPAHGDHDGRIFPDGDYTQFCLERGYLQRFVNVERSVWKAKNRVIIRGLLHYAKRRMLVANDYKALVTIADEFRYTLLGNGLPNLHGSAFFNGCMTMARKLRPDLVIMR